METVGINMNMVNVLPMVKNVTIAIGWGTLANNADKREFPPLIVEEQEKVQCEKQEEPECEPETPEQQPSGEIDAGEECEEEQGVHGERKSGCGAPSGLRQHPHNGWRTAW